MLSIIICTYNRDRYIYNVLRSLAENTLPREEYEIVLVDNNCTDRTREECARFHSDYPEVAFRYAVEGQQGLSHARNRGIREARGEVLVYVDDDATVNREYLRTYADFFHRHPQAWAAGGPILPVYETAEPAWFSRYTKTLITGYLYEGDTSHPFRHGRYPGGGNAAYRREVFYRTGLFNPELGRKGDSLVGAEEKEIFDKMTQAGMSFHYLPTAILYHIIPATKLTPEYFDRLTYSIGRSERQRTRSVSAGKYARRLVAEAVKWAATLVLLCGFCLRLQPEKGWMLVRFRWNVTRGLISTRRREDTKH